jgi:hypothetical protein
MKSDASRQLRRMLSRWESLLANPRWYLAVVPELDAFRGAIKYKSGKIRRACKERIYDFFEAHLKNGNIALRSNAIDSDRDRKPIDTIVIHHTGKLPGLTAERLSAIELVRLYAPYYAHPTQDADLHLCGESISGHVHNGKQVFWPYHWIVRRDGTPERLLRDSEIGWHAGNWDINCRSVAIVLDNDYRNSSPSVTEISAVTAIIERNYARVPLGRILGHREVNPKTVCPSRFFLDGSGRKGWKSKLLDQIALGSEQAA